MSQGLAEKEDIGKLVSFEFRRHFDLKGFDEMESDATEQSIQTKFYETAKDETRTYFFCDGIIIMLRDYHESGIKKGRELSSYALWPVIRINHLHTSDYPVGYRDAQLDSRTDFDKLRRFIQDGYEGFIPQEGIAAKDGMIYIKMDHRTERFPFDWNLLTETEMMRYESITPWYRPEQSPFTEAIEYISRNGFEELPKHQYEIVVAKIKHSFDKINPLKNWMV